MLKLSYNRNLNINLILNLQNNNRKLSCNNTVNLNGACQIKMAKTVRLGNS